MIIKSRFDLCLYLSIIHSFSVTVYGTRFRVHGFEEIMNSE